MKVIIEWFHNLFMFGILVILVKMFFMNDMSPTERAAILGAFSILYQIYVSHSYLLIKERFDDVQDKE